MVPNATLFKMKEPWFIYIIQGFTVSKLVKKAVRAINNYLKLEAYTDCRIWKVNNRAQWAYIINRDDALRNSGKGKVPINGTLINTGRNPNEEFKIVEDDIYMIETPRTNGTYAFINLEESNAKKAKEIKKGEDVTIGKQELSKRGRKRKAKKIAAAATSIEP